jgi:hypothetical protein
VHLSLASETSAENSAVGWAERQVGSSKYNGACLALVVEAYQQVPFPIRSHVTVTIGTNTVPINIWDHFSGGTTGGPSTSPPAGALFFWSNSLGAGDSHVAISTGGWNFVTASDVDNENDTHYETMTQFNANHDAHALGWWLPDGSSSPPPAAAAPAPAPTTSPTTAPLKVASGPTGSPVGGSTVQPASGGSTVQPASGGSSVQPASGSTGGGGSTSAPSGGGSTSSSGGSSTPVTPPTTSTPATPPVASPAPAPTTYSETVGGVSHTWTDYSDAGGNEGPSIASNQTVQIACKVTGFKVADGNTWWYRIAQSPWSNQYYVSADAFYNDGATSGSLSGTPFVDPAVPNC